MFARPSPPSVRGFAARPLDRPGGEGTTQMLTLGTLAVSMDDIILSTAALLRITPSANNGTAGELNYLLEC